MTHFVFVSYPHPDKALADGVVHSLEQRGVRCWVAPRDVGPGEDWAAEIVRAIDDCRLMVVVFSDATNESDHIVREVRAATEARKSIVPFRTDDVEPNGALRYYLGGTHWLDAHTGQMEDHLTELAERVASMIAADGVTAPATSAVQPVDSTGPGPTVEAGGSLWRRAPLWVRVATGAAVATGVVAVGMTLATAGRDNEPATIADMGSPDSGEEGDSAEAAPDVANDGPAAAPEIEDSVVGTSVTLALANGNPGGTGANLTCRIDAEGEACEPIGWPELPGGEDVVAADFDGDGTQDLAFAVLGTDPSEAATPDGHVLDQVCLAAADGYECSRLFDDEFASTTITAADVDQDGSIDLLVGGFADLGALGQAVPVELCLGDGAGGFGCRPFDETTAAGGLLEVYEIAVADVDRNGLLDILIAGNGANQICLGADQGTWGCSLVEDEPSETHDAAIADMDADGNLDLVVANWATPNRMCLGDGAGGFECSDFTSADNPSSSLDVGDLDGDGHLDVVVGRGLAGRDEGEIPDHRCLGDGSGALSCWEIPSSGDTTSDVLLADANGDGTLDVLRFGESNELCLGDGDGGYECRGLDLEYRDDRGFPVAGGFSSATIVEAPTAPTPGAPATAGAVTRVLVSDTGGSVWAYDLETDDLSPFAAVSGENYGIEFSPQGNLVVADFLGAVVEVDLETGEQRDLVTGELENPLGLEVLTSTDGTTYYVADFSGGIYSYDPERADLTLVVETGGGPRVTVGHDGWVYFTDGGRVARFEPSVTPAAPQTITELPGAHVAGLDLHPNGLLYAMVETADLDDPESVLEIDVDSGEVRVVHRGGPLRWVGDGVAGPGGYLYVADAGIPALQRVDPETGEVVTLHAGHPLGDPVDVILDRTS